ncbi:MAG: hypothetical protein KTR32_28805 [Granulosicoccus sp.]|nr:hypothetical protein [Granulosicoccus sp.]
MTQLLRNSWFTGLLRQWLIPVSVSLSATIYVSDAFAEGLTDPERQQAAAVADAVQWRPGLRNRSSTDHPLGLQNLSIESRERKKPAYDTLASVYQYHYDYQAARLLVVDLNQNLVVSEQPVNSVHLPLNQTEINLALTLLSQRIDILDRLRSEQRARGRSAFKSLQELQTKASIFEPVVKTHPCAEQRCALLSLFDHTNTVFAAEPIVNLQSLKVELLETR